MSMLNRTGLWLAPLTVSVFLLGNPAAVLAEEAKEATFTQRKAINLSADNQGDIHLRVSNKMLASEPGQLQNAMLEVIMADESHRSMPLQIDDSGNVHYLIHLGRDEAGTDIHLQPVSASTPLTQATSLLATGVGTLLTLKAVDMGYSYATNSKFMPLAGRKNDTFVKAMTKNYVRQGVLLSAFGNGQAISAYTRQALGIEEGGRTQWQDVIPELTSTVLTGAASWALHKNTAWHKANNLQSQVSLYHASSATNTFAGVFNKLNGATLNDLTDWDDKSIDTVSRIGSIIESGLILTLLDRFGANPATNGGKSWLKSYFTNSMAITAVYGVRELAVGATKNLTGNEHLSEFLTSAGMITSAGILQIASGGKLNMNDMTYRATIASMSAEAAGVSLAFGLQNLINSSLGEHEDSPKARAVRVGTLLLAGAVVHGVAGKIGAGTGTLATSLKKMLGPVGDGIIIANTMDILIMAKDQIVEPWIIKPLLRTTCNYKPESPAMRLRANATRRPLVQA